MQFSFTIQFQALFLQHNSPKVASKRFFQRGTISKPSALQVFSLMNGGGDLQRRAAAWRGISLILHVTGVQHRCIAVLIIELRILFSRGENFCHDIHKHLLGYFCVPFFSQIDGQELAHRKTEEKKNPLLWYSVEKSPAYKHSTGPPAHNMYYFIVSSAHCIY